jgi:hypothetical protein
MTNKYFVYIDGPNGPEPQIWYDKHTDGSGKDKPVLFIKTLSGDEERLTLDQLKNIYKVEEKEE